MLPLLLCAPRPSNGIQRCVFFPLYISISTAFIPYGFLGLNHSNQYSKCELKYLIAKMKESVIVIR